MSRAPTVLSRASSALIAACLALGAARPQDPQAPESQAPRSQAPESQVADSPDTFGHSNHGTAFDEGPRRSAYLMEGLNEHVHFPVEGLSQEGQRFFDQGICQQHGFWYFESERSFRQVAMLHPNCAMAYWGMTLANVDNPERAAEFIANAVQRWDHASERERKWIDAWADYYQIEDDDRNALQSSDDERIQKTIEALRKKADKRDKKVRDTLDKQLIEDLGTIVFEHPEDVEAKAFLALQNWHASRWGSGVEIVSHTAVDALLQQVLAAVPSHPVHHYRVHLWDREDARRALDSAARIGDSAPAIAHQWHMAGHIYAKLHRHEEAAWQQDASSRADHAHMTRDRVMPFLIHNYGHNQEWLARSLSHCGRRDEALAIARNLVELPRHPEHNQLDDRGSIAYYGRQRLISVCQDNDLWNEARQLAGDGYLEPSEDIEVEIGRLRLLARANFRLGRPDDAERIVAEVEALLERARSARSDAVDAAEAEAIEAGKSGGKLQEAVADATKGPTRTVEQVRHLLRELDGERHLANGEPAKTLESWKGIRGIPLRLRAMAQIEAGEIEKAVEALEKENAKNPHRMATVLPLTMAYSTDETRYGEALAGLADTVLSFAGPKPSLFVGNGEWVEASALDARAHFGEDFGERPPLDSIGPRTWSPVANPGFSLPVATGAGTRSTQADVVLSPDGDGRAKLVVFYLGFGCLHCVEQLHALRPLADRFAERGIDIIAIGTDDVVGTRDAHLKLSPEERLPFPLLANPGLRTFKDWHCYDDFEQMTLHGTFLVDGKGKIRWQDISYEPFMEIEWLLGEADRLLQLAPRSQ